MKKMLLSITLLLATTVAVAETPNNKTITATHKTFEELVKEGKAGVVAALAAYEQEAANTQHPHHHIIKKDLAVLKKISGASNTTTAASHAKDLSKETKDAIEVLYKHLGKLDKLSAATKWFQARK